MKIINVKIKEMRIKSFSARDYSVILDISFDDGAEKRISRHTVIDYPELVAEKIFNDIKKMEKNINLTFDEDMSSEPVRVVFEDEEESKKKTAKFLHSASERIAKIKAKRNAEGYMNMINELNMMKLVL